MPSMPGVCVSWAVFKILGDRLWDCFDRALQQIPVRWFSSSFLVTFVDHAFNIPFSLVLWGGRITVYLLSKTRTLHIFLFSDQTPASTLTHTNFSWKTLPSWLDNSSLLLHWLWWQIGKGVRIWKTLFEITRISGWNLLFFFNIYFQIQFKHFVIPNSSKVYSFFYSSLFSTQIKSSCVQISTSIFLPLASIQHAPASAHAECITFWVDLSSPLRDPLLD